MSPILDENSLEFLSRSPEQTLRLGAHLGKLLQGGDVVCLEGVMGTGKTCFAQGVGRGWGVSQTLVSPSYVLIREYRRPGGKVTLFHIDLYRIECVDGALSLGLDEVLGDERAVCVIEWAERARPLIPSEHLWMQLKPSDVTQRQLRFEAHGQHHSDMLREFRRLAFGV